MPTTMIRIRLACLFFAALIVLGAPAIGEAQTGYWQYVKTDTYINLYANQTGGNPAKPEPDTYLGSEGALTVTIGTGQQTFRFAASFAWSRPPAILIPGTALYWPASATIVQNTGNNVRIGQRPHQLLALFLPLFNRDEPRHRSELRKSRGNRGFL